MKRPIKSDYTTTNQFTYHEKLREYYDELEKYADYCDELINKTNDILTKNAVSSPGK